MTTTEIRLKCLELAMSNTYIQKDVNNQIAQAKIYENYLLGITEQTIAKKEEPLESYFSCEKIHLTTEEGKKLKNIFNKTKNVIMDVTAFKDLEDLAQSLNKLDKENEIFKNDFYVEHNNQYLVWLNKKMFMMV